LTSTLRHLRKLGVREAELQRLLAVVGPHFAHNSVPDETRTRPHALIAACRNFRVTAPLMRPTDRRRFIHRRQMAEWALRRDPQDET
jgi:hypothetical protein